MIPWDENVDIMIDVNLRPWLQTILPDFEPGYLFEKSQPNFILQTKTIKVTQNKAVNLPDVHWDGQLWIFLVMK